MKWKQPPIIKIYEALGALGDKRVFMSGNTAKIYSSTGSKYYKVKFDPAQMEISCNDNGSFWVGYLGYPAIAFLLKRGIIPFEKKFAAAVKGVHWKELNTKYKNDFSKTKKSVDNFLIQGQVDLPSFTQEVKKISAAVKKLNLAKLGPQMRPPSGF